MLVRIYRLVCYLFAAHLTGYLTPSVCRQFNQPKPWRRLKLLSLALTLALICALPVRAASITTFTTLSVTPGTSVTQGTALTLQASVSDGEVPIIQGSVTFYDGTQALGAVSIVRTGIAYPLGSANMKIYLGPGSHPLKAVYGAMNGNQASTSTTQTVTVSAASSAVTTTVLTATGAAGNYTFAGKVTLLSSVAPTGTVFFLDQTNSDFALGSAPLDPATLTSGWQTMTSIPAVDSSYGIVVGDLNADGKPDIVTSNYGGTSISVYLGNGDGTYQTHIDYAVPDGSFGMALGDLNGDGAPDLVVAYHFAVSSISVFLGNGDGTLQARQDYTSGSSASEYVAVGDFNRDGNLDVAALDAVGFVSILLGVGDGTLQAKTSYAAGSHPYGLATGDFNADGNLDLAVANDASGTVSVLLGNGDGTLQAQTTYPGGAETTGVIAADLNGDGKPDLIACNFQDGTVSVFQGNGDGTFQSKVDYTAQAWGLAAADVNGDGIMDVVGSDPNTQTVILLQGNGDGTLKLPVTVPTSASNYQVALADLNGDGVIDLALPDLGPSSIEVALGSISETATLAGVSIPGGGTHQAFASYAGDANSAVSTSASLALAGSQFSTTLALIVSPLTALPGQLVTLTSTLSPSASSGYTSTGTVTFYDSGLPVASAVTLVGGVAALAKSDFVLGSHSLTAVYSGDVNFTASTSAASTLNIGLAPDYSITADPSTITIQRGHTGSATLTITPLGAYTGTVSLSCSGLPAFARCHFSPVSVQLAGNNVVQTAQLTITTVAQVSALTTTPLSVPGHLPALALVSPFGMLGFLIVSTQRRRRIKSRWLVLLGIVMLGITFLGLTGCGSSSHPPSMSPAGTSNVTVTASAVGAGVNHSTAITVTITQ